MFEIVHSTRRELKSRQQTATRGTAGGGQPETVELATETPGKQSFARSAPKYRLRRTRAGGTKAAIRSINSTEVRRSALPSTWPALVYFHSISVASYVVDPTFSMESVDTAFFGRWRLRQRER
jgi:hypothetical protein